ncbi:SGNH/GDSL hydrolase family protein [Chelativorans sp. AA-79]|uniref:SGNH/GDSL hydrolase family protein n=1 Tax=Chelativorans sp. AA-79 TaxID=3028735 RepID=UPI0023F8B049|nr:SGNH/GDSL hydrolase family protein [Chelativorans sp. AA-79]WEX10803.1 SGNH/GDSL hydrolase family protein [Chelativorans sp. AA-79]
MERVIPIRTGIKAGTAAGFITIGVLLYLLLLAGSEYLVHRNGHMNPIFKIDAADRERFDWVILGASHAMPLDFGGFNSEMEEQTGASILNLAGPGTGPLYNRFVLEHFLREHSTENILYVADGFAFRSPMWNEDRLADGALLARTPFHLPLALNLAGYVLAEGVDPRALLDYLTGFSKLNNRERFRPDIWEGEMIFDRTFKPSALAEKKRDEYLHPAVADEEAAREHYLEEFAELVELAKQNRARVVVAKFPLPSRFAALLPNEAEFNAALQSRAVQYGFTFLDFSGAMDEPQFYADTDHLNRAGVTEFFERHLKPILARKQAPLNSSWDSQLAGRR